MKAHGLSEEPASGTPARQLRERHPRGLVELEAVDRAAHVMHETRLHHTDGAERGHALGRGRSEQRGVFDPEPMVAVTVSTRRRSEGAERHRTPPLPIACTATRKPRATTRPTCSSSSSKTSPIATSMTVEVPVDRGEHAAVGEQLDRADPEPMVTFARDRAVEAGVVERARASASACGIISTLIGSRPSRAAGRTSARPTAGRRHRARRSSPSASNRAPRPRRCGRPTDRDPGTAPSIVRALR